MQSGGFPINGWLGTVPASDMAIELVQRGNVSAQSSSMIHTASAYPRRQARGNRTVPYISTDEGAGFLTVCDIFNANKQTSTGHPTRGNSLSFFEERIPPFTAGVNLTPPRVTKG
jgi:hypothetical protein